MKKIISVLIFCFVMIIGVLYASDEIILLKGAPDYKVYYNGTKVTIVSNLKKDEALTKNVILNNSLIERYQVFLPLYIQIDDDGIITRASLVKNGQSIATEKELAIKRDSSKLEVAIEQVVGMPDGVGMTAETINQSQRVYSYEIDWTVRGFVQKITNIDVAVIREYEKDIYDSIYENMINKNYTEIYSTVMGMSNIELSVLENYLASRYGVEWDVDAKLTKEMRELNLAKIEFSDINTNHWAYNVIKNMAGKGILNGYEDGTFRPENNITRAETAKILSKLFNLATVNKQTISDLSIDHWAYDAIRKASVYIPMSGDIFDGESNITRKDFIVAIMNLRETSKQLSENVFPDLEGLSEDDLSKINMAHSLNIITGYEDGTFRPNEPLTRAEACAILSRAK